MFHALLPIHPPKPKHSKPLFPITTFLSFPQTFKKFFIMFTKY
ncbi:hypothetical protein D3OALGB2SA_4948 [Olavius algarvensis associated proteobacterium Delta 3]|nr:hypothetical protein D3OALGB2SA_4948 [Olavius algarvensis associated proteobacterium Delta 3]